MAKNNESIGISVEVAIAKSYDLCISIDYANRAENEIVNFLLKNNYIKTIFNKEGIPKPVEHVAEGQNPIDFLLSEEKTLSVKTNQSKLGKVAPQVIGQPTAETYFDYIVKNNILGFEFNIPDDYIEKCKLFKKFSIKYIDKLINMYWNKLFDCDYLFTMFNLEEKKDPLENYRVFVKGVHPLWEKEKFTFTQNIGTWNESNTVKYDGVSIGEFQVHRHRNCFKFRFDMNGIVELLSLKKI